MLLFAATPGFLPRQMRMQRLAWASCLAALLLVEGAAAARAESVFRIGVLEPRTGPFASPGERQLRGIRVALDEVNSRVGDVKIEIQEIEEPGDPQTALQRVRAITSGDNRVNALVGVFQAHIGNAIRDQLHESGTPTVIANTYLRALTGSRRSPYLFRVSSTTWTVTRVLADWAAGQGACKTTATIASNNAVGQEFVRLFAARYESQNGKVPDKLWPPLGSTDFAPYLTQLIKLKPDCVYAWVNGPDSVRLAQQFDQFGLRRQGIRLIGESITDQVLVEAQGRSAIGIQTEQSWEGSLDNPANREFTAALRKAHGQSPDFSSFTGYLGMKAVLRAVASLKPDQLQDRQALLAALRAVSFPAPDGYDFAFDPQTQTRRISYSVYDLVENGSGTPTFKLLKTYPPLADPGDDVQP